MKDRDKKITGFIFIFLSGDTGRHSIYGIGNIMNACFKDNARQQQMLFLIIFSNY